MDDFQLVSDFQPQGDQPQAIKKLVDGVNSGVRTQVLLGVTGFWQNVHHGQCHRAIRENISGPRSE